MQEMQERKTLPIFSYNGMDKESWIEYRDFGLEEPESSYMDIEKLEKSGKVPPDKGNNWRSFSDIGEIEY